MAQSLAKLYVHAIFSTKNRVPCLSPEICAHLYPYAATVLNNMECPAIQVGGASDHIHILCVLSKKIAAMDLIEKIKVPTSIFLKEQGANYGKFSWQNGYGIFSVSQSSVERVRAYIQTQEEHHRKRTFQEEFRRFLIKYQIPFDEQYVWD